MNIRKWRSNDAEMMNHIKDVEGIEDESIEVSHASMNSLNTSDTNSERVLGIPWKVDTDELELEYKMQFKEKRCANITITKRVNCFSSLHPMCPQTVDPLGILCPSLLPLKLMFQKLCKEKQGWDSHLDEHCALYWKKWFESAKKFNKCLKYDVK